jgi:MFS family permease
MTTQPTPKGAWKITFLLFLFMLVNFADKIVVGLAGVPIMTELKLEPEEFGLLGSSFFFLYSIAAIVVGFIVNRVATRWVLLALALIWALAQFPMVGTVGFVTLLVCRVILGAGEGPAFSVAAHSIYKWFPDEKRTLPTAILSQGSAFGVILAVPALNWVIVNYSWHYGFRRARHRRPDVGRGVADPGQGRAAGSHRGDGGGGAAHSLFPAFDLANLYRLLRRHFRRLLGALAWPHLVHALYRQWVGLLAKGRGVDFDSAVGVRCRRRAADGVDFAGVDGAWPYHPWRARRAGRGSLDRRRIDPCRAPA